MSDHEKLYRRVAELEDEVAALRAVLMSNPALAYALAVEDDHKDIAAFRRRITEDKSEHGLKPGSPIWIIGGRKNG